MKKRIDKESNDRFRNCILDTNILHDDDYMRERFGRPGIVTEMQLLCTALGTLDERLLEETKIVRGYFTGLVPIGSEVEFGSERIEGKNRVSANLNGIGCLGSGSYASNGLGERITFYEERSPMLIIPHENELSTFQELTGLGGAVYAAALSTASIIAAVTGSCSPLWKELSDGMINEDEKKIKLPVYEEILFYFPNGAGNCEIGHELEFRFAICKERKRKYIIDTTCYGKDGLLAGVRSYLTQNQLKVLLKFIDRTLKIVNFSKV